MFSWRVIYIVIQRWKRWVTSRYRNRRDGRSFEMYKWWKTHALRTERRTLWTCSIRRRVVTCGAPRSRIAKSIIEKNGEGHNYGYTRNTVEFCVKPSGDDQRRDSYLLPKRTADDKNGYGETANQSEDWNTSVRDCDNRSIASDRIRRRPRDTMSRLVFHRNLSEYLSRNHRQSMT